MDAASGEAREALAAGAVRRRFPGSAMRAPHGPCRSAGGADRRYARPGAGRPALARLAVPAESDPVASGARASGPQHPSAPPGRCSSPLLQNRRARHRLRPVGKGTGRESVLPSCVRHPARVLHPDPVGPEGGVVPPYLPHTPASRGSGKARTASGGFAAARALHVPGSPQQHGHAIARVIG